MRCAGKDGRLQFIFIIFLSRWFVSSLFHVSNLKPPDIQGKSFPDVCGRRLLRYRTSNCLNSTIKRWNTLHLETPKFLMDSFEANFARYSAEVKLNPHHQALPTPVIYLSAENFTHNHPNSNKNPMSVEDDVEPPKSRNLSKQSRGLKVVGVCFREAAAPQTSAHLHLHIQLHTHNSSTSPSSSPTQSSFSQHRFVCFVSTQHKHHVFGSQGELHPVRGGRLCDEPGRLHPCAVNRPEPERARAAGV